MSSLNNSPRCKFAIGSIAGWLLAWGCAPPSSHEASAPNSQLFVVSSSESTAPRVSANSSSRPIAPVGPTVGQPKQTPTVEFRGSRCVFEGNLISSDQTFLYNDQICGCYKNKVVCKEQGTLDCYSKGVWTPNGQFSADTCNPSLCTDGRWGPHTLLDCSFKVTQRIDFAANADAISATQQPILQAIAQFLKQHEEIEHLVIIGRANPSENGPEALSRRRAQAVFNELVVLGVKSSVLTIEAAGATKPLVTPGPSPALLTLNRSTTFITKIDD